MVRIDNECTTPTNVENQGNDGGRKRTSIQVHQEHHKEAGICVGHNNAKITRRVKQKYRGVVFHKSTGKWFICVTLQLEKQRFTP